MSADTYSRPERFSERAAAKRIKKRMDADRRRNGLCVICTHRETTFGIHHCTNKPDRRNGQCQFDRLTPTFEFDAATLERYRDAA